MSTNPNIQIFSQNPYQNAEQVLGAGFSNNLPYCGADSKPVTAEEFNSRVGTSYELATRLVSGSEDEEVEPAFGAHIREAVTTVKKIFGR